MLVCQRHKARVRGGSFFIEDVLVGHSGTVDMRPGFIEMRMKGGGFL